jgi:thiosulfate/3-mercaptopyruvate sulfurtransferase
LQAFGHPAVSLLDGGLQGWLSRGHTVQGGAGARSGNQTAGTFQGEPDPRRIADADHILRGLNRPDMQIVDTRSAAEYRGEDVRARRGGHIPGAVHLDWNATKAGPDGIWFKDTETLNALLNEKGLDPAKETVCYCQSHQRSALVCVLLESLGFENVKGYPGAWSDWGNRFDTPVEV